MMSGPVVADGDRNLLDSVLLSQRAVDRWLVIARDAAGRLAPGLAPAAIRNEEAEILDDGALRLFCADASGRVIAEMVVPANEWAWQRQGVQ